MVFAATRKDKTVKGCLAGAESSDDQKLFCQSHFFLLK